MASVALVRSATAVNTTGVTTLAVNLPASATVGDYLVVTVYGTNNNSTGFLNANLSTATVADNATGGTNTYTRQTSLFDNVVDLASNFDSCGAAVFVAPVARTNAGTFTVTVTTSLPIGDTSNELRITVSEWSGVAGVEGFTTLNTAQLSVWDYSVYPPITGTAPGDMLVTSQTVAGDAVTYRAGLGTSNVLAWTSASSVEYISIANARQVLGTVYALVAGENSDFSFSGIALLLKSTNAAVASVPGHNVEFAPREFPIQAYDAWDGFPRLPSRTYDGLMFNRKAAAAVTVPFTLRAKDLPNPTTRPVAAQQEVGFNNTIRQVAPAANPVPLLLRAKDFPNPVTRVAAQPVQPDFLTVRTIQAPFRQTDWPNPVVSKAPSVVHAFAGSVLALGLLVAGGTPFKPVDAPNPTTRPVAAQHDVGSNNTIRQVAPAANPVPFTFRAKDLPNPVTRIYPQHDVGSNNTIRQVAPSLTPFKPADLPNPITRVSAQPVQPDFLTLRAISAPFGQSDFPNPVTRVYPQPDVLPNTTIRQVAPSLTPFKPADLPNPITRVYPQPDQPDFLRVLSVPGPFKQVDWPNPVTRVYPQPDVLPNTTIRQVAPPPVRPTDLPNPITRVYPQPDQPDFLRVLSVPGPFKQVDWPNPITRVYPQPDVLPNTTIRQVAPPPVRPTDLPNPITRVYPQPDVLPNTTIRQVAPPPFSLKDWINPVTRVAAQQDVGANLTLQIAPPNAPFKGADLPNPVTRAFAQQDVGINYTIRIPVIPAPFKQTDWPNPQFRAPRGITFDPAFIKIPPSVIVIVTGVTGFGTIGQVTVQITNLWTPVDDSQVPNWGALPDSQTPNWIPIVDAQTPGWAVVNDSQATNWTAVTAIQTTAWATISDAQTPNWVAVTDSQTPNWVPVTDSQTPAWTAVLNTQSSNWTSVIDAQGSTWTLVDDSQNPNWK